jgi:3-hydroxybutyryl-CoA dehydrogenase
MQVAVIATESQRQEWGPVETTGVTWIGVGEALPAVDAVVDLCFENTPDRIAFLSVAPLAIVNSVTDTLADIGRPFVRFNGWATFLSGSLIEAAGADGHRAVAESVFTALGKEVVWLPDTPGFVTPRVIAGIVNEAYFALAEGVSTRAEIDTAMKLGTAYPDGPFSWGDRIGLREVAALLLRLSGEQTCGLLKDVR